MPTSEISRRLGGLGPPTGSSRRDDRGQAAVELALCLPVLFVVLLGLVQAAVVVRDQVLLTHAAREAAREAAVSDDRAKPMKAAVARSGLDPGRLRVEVTGQRPGSGKVMAKLTYQVPTAVPIVGVLVPDLTLRSAVSMRREGR